MMTCDPPALHSTLEASARQSARDWVTAAPVAAHRGAAVSALDGGECAGDGQAVAMLSRALWEACGDLVACFASNPDPTDLAVGVPRTRDEMLALDAALAGWLAKLDASRADKLRDNARLRWTRHVAGELDALGLFKLWVNGGIGALAAVAWTLWKARVEPLWLKRRNVRPALVRGVAEVLAHAMSGQTGVSGDNAVRDADGRTLGRIASLDVQTLDAVRSGLPLLGSIAWHRLLNFLVLAVHDAAEARIDDARTVDFHGGFEALAESIRDGTNDFRRLRAILQVGQHIEWMHPAVMVGGLWTWTVRRGGPGRPGLVRIIVGDPLAPSLAARLADTGDTSRQATVARRLVPELRTEPPLSAVRINDQGAAWTLFRSVMVELVDLAPMLATTGTVLITPDRWRELAERAGLPTVELSRLRDSWSSGDDRAPPLLAQPDPGLWRFTLADTHSAERAFIAEGGQRRLNGGEAGRKGKGAKETGNHK